MLNLYKYSTGSTREPQVGVSYYTDEGASENCIQLVSAAGRVMEESPIYTLYLYNDSLDMNFTDLILFSIDHDTSSGSNESSWLEFSVLDEGTGTWSIWSAVLTLNDVLYGDKTLSYYADGTTSIRDLITMHVRFAIPVGEQTQMKEDITVSVKAGTEANVNGGRP
jgi:hypothetical protein